MSVAPSRKDSAAIDAGDTDVKLPPFGHALIAVVVTLVIGSAVFGVLLDKQIPGPGWSVLGVTLFAIYLEYRFLPGLRERRALSVARTEAKRLLKAVSNAVRREKGWAGGETQGKVDAAQQSLTQALTGTDSAEIEQQTKALEDLADKVFTRKSLKREYVEQIGAALLAALTLRAFFYEAFKIPSGSMLPTLDIGDHLFVNKFVYGLRVPFTVKKFFTRFPERGDVVVFDRPGDEGGDAIIKRVIGLPGDIIKVENRHVTINGTVLPTEYEPAIRINEDGDREGTTSEGPFFTVRPFQESIGRHRHTAFEMEDRRGSAHSYPNEGTWMVEPGKVFLMGDNRDNSQDSRFSPGGPACDARGGESKCFGQVPVDYIKGRADIIWLSLGGPHGIRFERLFHKLE